MPQLRFSRDKRGYENTFVVNADTPRGRGRSRILYWFRTPPGVKVGRSALDEDAIRLIEEHNRDLEFDWTRILKGEEPPPDRRQPQRSPPIRHGRQPRQAAPGPSAPRSAPAVRQADPLPPTAEPANGSEPGAPIDEGPITAAHGKLGSEGVSRLRGRYAEMRARIDERVSEPDRQAELNALAERLNPDAWVTHADVLAGLDSYEATFESLRSVVGHRRRRPARRSEPARTEPVRNEPTE